MERSRSSITEQIIKKAWMDAAFRSQLLRDPKSAIEEVFGVNIPAGIRINVVEETPDTVYLVLPVNPAEKSTLMLTDSVGTAEEDMVW